jgi:serine/threonine protein kinase
MGEVYRARDTRLKREVAIKILPQDVARDPLRRQRFEGEARSVAALNHRNVVAIHDVGAENGGLYIVTELIDGRPLRGAFTLRKILDYAVQTADGLAAAHAACIIHRDLKPDNILLTRDGHIKILDFGLAKANVTQMAAAATETLTAHTEPGVVMGTVGYMSPEQVRGADADHRSDIFSFGVIFYELLSGRRAFQGYPQRGAARVAGRCAAGNSADFAPLSRKRSGQPLSVGTRSVVRDGCSFTSRQPEQRYRASGGSAAVAPPGVDGGYRAFSDDRGRRRLSAVGPAASAGKLDRSAFGRTGNRL